MLPTEPIFYLGLSILADSCPRSVVALAVFCLNLGHPGFGLASNKTEGLSSTEDESTKNNGGRVDFP